MMESGAREFPAMNVLAKLAETLGVSLDWLVRGVGEPPGDDVLAAAVRAARDKQSAQILSDTGPHAIQDCGAHEPTGTEG